MPKQKTHKGLKKRVKVSANGKVKHKRPGGGHLMSSKTSKRRSQISKDTNMSETFAKKARIFLGK